MLQKTNDLDCGYLRKKNTDGYCQL